MISFETILKVRTYECDFYGHVNNATFLNYCEYARVEFLHFLGYNLENLKQKGFVLPIVKIEIEYKEPVFADEVLKLKIEWISRGRSSSTFKQDIIRQRDNSLVAQAYVTWVVTDLKGKPISIPKELLERVNEKYSQLPLVSNED